MSKTTNDFEATEEDFGPFSDTNVITDTPPVVVDDSNGLSVAEAIEVIKQYLLTSDFQTILRGVIQDQNFIDTFKVLINNQIKLDREFIVLDRAKVLQAINNPSDILNIFSEYEIKVLINQAKVAGYVDAVEDAALAKDYRQIVNYLTNAQLQKLIEQQYLYKTNIPSISDLNQTDLTNVIINTILSKPEVLVNIDLIKTYTDSYLDEVSRTTYFTPYYKVEQIYANPYSIMAILTKEAFTDLLKREAHYLEFITDEKIAAMNALTDPAGIRSIFTSNEITTIMDKELDQKNEILKTLSISEVTAYFDSFRTKFFSTELTKDMVKLGNVDNTADKDKIVLAATKLVNPVTIAGVLFDGLTNINIPFRNLSDIPNTLAEHGITDAYTKTETDDKFKTKADAAIDKQDLTNAINQVITNLQVQTDHVSIKNNKFTLTYPPISGKLFFDMVMVISGDTIIAEEMSAVSIVGNTATFLTPQSYDSYVAVCSYSYWAL